MQVLAEFVIADRVPDHSAGEDIECAALQVNDGCRGDANIGPNKRTLYDVFRWHGNAARLVEKAYFPQRRIAGAERVEGVDAIVLRGDEQNVMRAFTGNLDRRKEERLRVYRAIHLKGADLAKLFGIDILGSEDLLVQRGAGAEVVVLRRCDLSRGGSRGQSKNEGSTAIRDRFHWNLGTAGPSVLLILDVERARRIAAPV